MTTGCPKKDILIEQNLNQNWVLNFIMGMTWGRLILLSLRKKWPKNQSPDKKGAGKWWLSQCKVAPTAFWKCFFLGNHVYPNYNDPQRQESRRPVQAGTLQFQAGPDCSDLRSRRRCRRSRNADSEIVGCWLIFIFTWYLSLVYIYRQLSLSNYGSVNTPSRITRCHLFETPYIWHVVESYTTFD